MGLLCGFANSLMIHRRNGGEETRLRNRVGWAFCPAIALRRRMAHRRAKICGILKATDLEDGLKTLLKGRGSEENIAVSTAFALGRLWQSLQSVLCRPDWWRGHSE